MAKTITFNGTDYEATAETLGLSFESNTASAVFSVPGTFGQSKIMKNVDLTQADLVAAFNRIASPPCTVTELKQLLIDICEEAAFLKFDDNAPE